ncbi:MAG: sigma-70 family RNA polymerase sigma factor [Nitrospirota bacterium]
MKEKPDPSDEDLELVALCRKGDVDAFEALVAKYQKRMFNIAFRMTGNNEDASEIVQDAFVAVYRNIKGFQERAGFSTWLCTIVLNLSRNRLKQIASGRTREAYSLNDPLPSVQGTCNRDIASDNPSVLDTLEKREVQQKVQGCIQSMDGDYRELIILRDVQGFSYREISDMLTIPEGTVKSGLSRARAALRDCLKKVLGDV